jgi:hypothetical protein
MLRLTPAGTLAGAASGRAAIGAMCIMCHVWIERSGSRRRRVWRNRIVCIVRIGRRRAPARKQSGMRWKLLRQDPDHHPVHGQERETVSLFTFLNRIACPSLLLRKSERVGVEPVPNPFNVPAKVMPAPALRFCPMISSGIGISAMAASHS